MNVSKEEYLAAVIEGIRQGIRDCMPSKSEIFEAIQQGTADALYCSGPSAAIKQAISDSFPFPGEITDAIFEGARDGVKGRK
jgi:hypothetical protein